MRCRSHRRKSAPPLTLRGCRQCQYQAAKWTLSSPVTSRAPRPVTHADRQKPGAGETSLQVPSAANCEAVGLSGGMSGRSPAALQRRLEERREAWKTCAATVNYYHQATQLPEIRKADPVGQGRWSAGSQQQTLRRLDRAFAAFFRRVKAGEKRPGIPEVQGLRLVRHGGVACRKERRRAGISCPAPDCDRASTLARHRQCTRPPAPGRTGHASRWSAMKREGRPLVRHPGLR